MNPNSPYPNQQRPRQQRMAQYQVTDEQNGRLVVSTFAHPSGWQARSQVFWNMQHTNLPALVYAATFNPNGAECFEFLPTQAFFWLEGDYGIVPIGQNAHGLVRMPPRPAPDALANLVIPQLRGDRQNLRIVGAHPVANLWQATNDPPPQVQSEGVVARVEYEEQGLAFEEEFYGMCAWVPATGGALNWGFGRLFCFRAERGQLDHVRQTFWQIAGSLRPNPRWGQLYDQIAQQLMSGVVVHNKAVVRGIYALSEIGRRNMAYNEQLRNQRTAEVNASIERQRQQNHERSQHTYTAHDAFADALGGQTPYHDPNSAAGNYHYESGYPQYLWTDNQGNFYPTNDPMDNPNQHQNGYWVEAKPVKPNQ